MTTRLTYLGVAGYLIEGPGRKILIDPYLTSSPAAPFGPDALPTPDVILVSHAAFDHLGDTADIARRTGAPVVCGADTRALLLEQGVPSNQIRATVWGIVVEVGGVVVRPVESHHWSSAKLDSGGTVSGVPLGFIVEPEPDVRVYHFGDSAIFGDMRLIGELHRPDVAFLPIGGHFTMDPRGAAHAADLLGVLTVVPIHYGTFPLLSGTPDELRAALRERGLHDVELISPEPGETMG